MGFVPAIYSIHCFFFVHLCFCCLARITGDKLELKPLRFIVFAINLSIEMMLKILVSYITMTESLEAHDDGLHLLQTKAIELIDDSTAGYNPETDICDITDVASGKLFK